MDAFPQVLSAFLKPGLETFDSIEWLASKPQGSACVCPPALKLQARYYTDGEALLTNHA